MWASSVGLYQKHKPQHPHHVKARGNNFCDTSKYTLRTVIYRVLLSGFFVLFCFLSQEVIYNFAAVVCI